MTQEPMDWEGMLVEKAMASEAFKRELISKPKAVIAREIGQKWPDDVDIVVLEPTPAKLYLVLPPKGMPESTPKDELSMRSVSTGDDTKTQEPMDMETLLIGKAIADEAFKRELLSNPKAAISREIGQKWPDGIDIVVLEPTPEKLYMVLPPQVEPEEILSDELSDEELEAVAGGVPYFTKKCETWHAGKCQYRAQESS